MDGVSSVKVQARQDGRHSGGCPVDSKLCFPSSQVTRIKRRVIRMYVAVITFEANQWKFCLLFASHLYMPNVDAVLFLTVGRFAAASLLSCFFFFYEELSRAEALLPSPAVPMCDLYPCIFGFRSLSSGQVSGARLLFPPERGLEGRSHLVFVRAEHGVLESRVWSHRSGERDTYRAHFPTFGK